MAFAQYIRQEIESALAGRGRMKLAPRLVCPGVETGYLTLDAVLRGGLPVAGTSELVGERTSGRATVASAYVAARTREGHICAWVDVGGELDGAACETNGADLERLLVIRCVGEPDKVCEAAGSEHVSASVTRTVTSYRKDKTIGTPGAQNRSYAESGKRVEQVATDRMPARRGVVVLERRDEMRVLAGTRPFEPKATAKKPWGRLEQGIKAVDLLIQAGGFGTIVFDLGSVSPHFVRKIPLATWFRWRAALERTRTSLVVLSQMGCAGSSAELVIRVEAEMPGAGTVLCGGGHRIEVVRRRFAEVSVEQRKGPQRAEASAWESRATWRAG
jgi:recombination protein RecA